MKTLNSAVEQLNRKKENADYMAKQVPKWVFHEAIEACMSEKDRDISIGILNRYNDLTDRDNEEGDGFDKFGIEDEKQDLIREYIAIHAKYREEASQLINKEI